MRSRQVRVYEAGPEAHEELSVRRFDWHRIRTAVDDLKRLVPKRDDFGTWGTLFVGLSVSFGVSLIPMVTGTQQPRAWALAFCAALCFAFALAAVCTFVFGRKRESADAAITKIISDMDEIESWYPVKQEEV
jgi:hypothetical protein